MVSAKVQRMCRVGQNHIYTVYIYGIFGREITKYTVIYGVHIRFWPTLRMCTFFYSVLYRRYGKLM